MPIWKSEIDSEHLETQCAVVQQLTRQYRTSCQKDNDDGAVGPKVEVEGPNAVLMLLFGDEKDDGCC